MENYSGADPGFQVRGARKFLGVFRVKNHDFTPKNHIFSNFRGGGGGGCCPPLLLIVEIGIYICNCQKLGGEFHDILERTSLHEKRKQLLPKYFFEKT